MQHNIGRIIFGFAAALFSAALPAHPHAWADVASTIVISESGMVAAIEEEWLFDELYSITIVEGMAQDLGSTEHAVDAFAAKVINNLRPYDYFMRLTADERPVQLADAVHFKSEMRDRQLLLTFTVPLIKPVDPMRHALRLEVYDPSYYIQMAHRKDRPPAVKGGKSHPCRARVEQPDPGPQDIARAFALDRSETPEDNLGSLFAEKVFLECRQ